MKPLNRTKITSALLSLLAVFSLVPSNIALAAGSSLSVSPASQSLQPGQSFTVQVRGNIANEPFGADTVSGTLVFPPNLLKVTSVSTAGATMNWQVSATPGNGTVAFNERAFFAINNTSVFVMAVTFQALGNGTASVGFSSNSRFSQGAWGPVPTSLSGATYTISTPAPATCPAGQIGTPPNCRVPAPSQCPAGQTGTPPNCKAPAATCPAGQTGTPPNCKSTTTPGGPSTPATPTPAAPTPVTSPDISNDTTPDNGFSISEVTATRSYNSTLLNWKTSGASKASISYGTSLKDLNKKVDAILLPDTTYEAKLTDLTPGKQYYYTINATSDADPAKTDAYSGVFTTRGFPVVVAITENKSQIANAKLKIGEQNYSTDKSGRISLELASGSYNVEVKTPKGAKTFIINVAKKTIPENGNALDVQRFTLDVPLVASSSSSTNLWLIIGGLGGGALLIGGVLFLLWKRRRNQDTQQPVVITSESDFNWAPQQPQPPMPPVPEFSSTMPLPPTDNQSMAMAEIPPPMATAQATDEQAATATLPYPPTDEGTGYTATPTEITSETIPSEDVNPSEEPAMQSFVQDQPAFDPGNSTATIEPESIPPNKPTMEQDTANDTSDTYPAAEVIETPSGDELQINHEDRHNSVYLEEEEPKDMFEIAKNTPPSSP